MLVDVGGKGVVAARRNSKELEGVCKELEGYVMRGNLREYRNIMGRKR